MYLLEFDNLYIYVRTYFIFSMDYQPTKKSEPNSKIGDLERKIKPVVRIVIDGVEYTEVHKAKYLIHSDGRESYGVKI